MAGQPNDNTYITGLPVQVDSETVKSVFQSYGATVVQCKVLPVVGNSDNAHALVRFSSLEEAQQVVATLSGQELQGLEGSPLKIGYAYSPKDKEGFSEKGKGKGGDSYGPAGGVQSLGWGGGQKGGKPYSDAGKENSRTVYCAGLPSDCDQSMAQAFFEGFGELNYVKLLQPKIPGGKRAAIVEFKEISSAKGMLAQPLLLEGESQPLKVNMCEQRDGSGGGDGGWSNGGGDGGWGGCCKGKDMGKGGGKGKGNDINTICEGLENSGALPGGDGSPTSDVYIAGLPADTTDWEIYRIFSPFGPIAPKGVRAIKNPDGSCKGIAFVNYLVAASAENAIAVLNGCQLPDSSFLKVAIKTNKK